MLFPVFFSVLFFHGSLLDAYVMNAEEGRIITNLEDHLRNSKFDPFSSTFVIQISTQQC